MFQFFSFFMSNNIFIWNHIFKFRFLKTCNNWLWKNQNLMAFYKKQSYKAIPISTFTTLNLERLHHSKVLDGTSTSIYIYMQVTNDERKLPTVLQFIHLVNLKVTHWYILFKSCGENKGILWKSICKRGKCMNII